MSEINEERYLYTVYPKKPIRNLTENIPILRVSKSLYLTKEEVLKCFECGSVYRRFSNDGIVEKFNKYEIDRVHRAHYISREDWAKMLEEKQGGESPAETLTVNGATSVEEPQEIKEEKIEEVVVTVEEEPVTVSNCINQDQPLVIEAPEPTAENIVYINTTSIKNDPIEIEIHTEDISTEEEVPVEEVVEDEEQVEDETTEEEETVESENVEEANTQNRPAVSLNYNGKKKKHH